jgi:hypothetical protein
VRPPLTSFCLESYIPQLPPHPSVEEQRAISRARPQPAPDPRSSTQIFNCRGLNKTDNLRLYDEMSESSGQDNRRGRRAVDVSELQEGGEQGHPAFKKNTHNSRSASDVLENFP